MTKDEEITYQCFQAQLCHSGPVMNVPYRSWPFWILMPSFLHSVFLHAARLFGETSVELGLSAQHSNYK